MFEETEILIILYIVYQIVTLDPINMHNYYLSNKNLKKEKMEQKYSKFIESTHLM
jgi:hypothetical protein